MKKKIGDWLFYILSVTALFLFIVAADYTVYAVCKDVLKMRITEILLMLIAVTMFLIWFLFRGLSMFRTDKLIADRS